MDCTGCQTTAIRGVAVIASAHQCDKRLPPVFVPPAPTDVCTACGDSDHRPATFRGGHFYTTVMNSR